MKNLLKIVSFTGLILTLVPSFLVFGNVIELDLNKNLMILGTFLWFLTVPFWMNKRNQEN